MKPKEIKINVIGKNFNVPIHGYNPHNHHDSSLWQNGLPQENIRILFNTEETERQSE